ncbi:hypothetical protein LZ31DRAFT_601887 [Colletotrichum somersetense]|nr:hypothetical protein LZ31DRAFT_601887 [Colletotrichum somersetense]
MADDVISAWPQDVVEDPSSSLRPAPSQVSGSKRLCSPVRAMSNLQFAEKPVKIVTARFPATSLCFWRTSRRLSKAERVSFRRRCKRDIADIWQRMNKYDDIIEEKHLDRSLESRPMRKLSTEQDELAWVVRDTKEATNRDHCEAHWNERIHSRILTAAIERDRCCANPSYPLTRIQLQLDCALEQSQ